MKLAEVNDAVRKANVLADLAADLLVDAQEEAREAGDSYAEQLLSGYAHDMRHLAVKMLAELHLDGDGPGKP